MASTKGLNQLAGSLSKALERHQQRLAVQQQLASSIALNNADRAFKERMAKEQQDFQLQRDRTRNELNLDLLAKENELKVARDVQEFKNEKGLIRLREEITGGPDRKVREADVEERKKRLLFDAKNKKDQSKKDAIGVLNAQRASIESQLNNPLISKQLTLAQQMALRDQLFALTDQLRSLGGGTIPLADRVQSAQLRIDNMFNDKEASGESPKMPILERLRLRHEQELELAKQRREKIGKLLEGAITSFRHTPVFFR